MCNKVLFPAPDSPTIASISPRFTSNDKFSKSTRSDSPDRKTFFSPCTRSSGKSAATCLLRCNLPPLGYIPPEPYIPQGENRRTAHTLTPEQSSIWPTRTLYQNRSLIQELL